jgi:anti-sigma regulatory factor (Ser/Thr protein kinase)
MDIHLPNSAFLGNIDPFLRSFNPKNPDTLNITANKKWISLHPAALSMIAALGLTLEPSKITCETFEAASKHYFERMGLFRFLRIDSGITMTEHESAGRFIPLTQIKDSNTLSSFLAEMTPLLHVEPKHAEPIRYIVSELVRNVIEHSLSSQGAIVSAQYHTKSNTIRIGVADTGVGIWQTINNVHNPKNDLEAVRLALTPGITGTTSREGGTEFNAGAGLFFVKSIATVNRNFFVIYSGSALYKLLKRKTKTIKLQADPYKDRHTKHNDLPPWKGTVIGIDISLDTTKEFSDLLDLIRTTYSVAIRERKKERYKKPQFI